MYVGGVTSACSVQQVGCVLEDRVAHMCTDWGVWSALREWHMQRARIDTSPGMWPSPKDRPFYLHAALHLPMTAQPETAIMRQHLDPSELGTKE